MLSGTRYVWANLFGVSNTLNRCLNRDFPPSYSKKCGKDECSRAIVDIPPEVDPLCPQPCERRKKKKEGILHRIKLRFVEGGTNFGTPFRRVDCKSKDKPVEYEEVLEVEKKKVEETKALVPTKVEKKMPAIPLPEPGVQVSILGAESAIGQYVALLLKQCSCIKKLRLYQAQDTQGCTRELCQVVHDLQHINTSCGVQAFSCACYELERCLQNTDIVLMLESGCVSKDMPFDQRFCCQAPMVKCYADAISNECPNAFIIVCTTPTDCMVPLIAETLKETGWYDPRKLFGSLAVQEMRASTLAARALCLEPRYTRVPCVGGTEGESLVPLFSKAVQYFDFAKHNAMLMTDAVRTAPAAVTRADGGCVRSADLSEAHALAGHVTKVAHAMLCHDIPRVTGFVETDACQVISPSRFIANHVDIGGSGIIKSVGLPKMNETETTLMNLALCELNFKEQFVADWYLKYCSSTCRLDSAFQTQFFTPKYYDRYLALDTLLNREGICKIYDLPPRLNSCELDLLDTALCQISTSVNMAETWFVNNLQEEAEKCQMAARTDFHYPKSYARVEDCNLHLT